MYFKNIKSIIQKKLILIEHSKLTISLFLISLFSLFLVRLYFYYRYPESFSDLEPLELLNAFLIGIKVDIITISTFIGFLVLLMILPQKQLQNKTLQKLLSYIWLIFLILILFVCIADILYFEYVGRHVSTEFLLTLESDFVPIIKLVYQSYLIETIFFLLFIVILFIIWKKIFEINTYSYNYSHSKVFFFLIILLLIFFGARGKFIDKPFGIADAFTTSKLSSGNLSINGFFSFYRSIGAKKINHNFMKREKAINIVHKALKNEKTIYVDPKYPILRKYPDNHTKHNYNVVIILLESWSSRYIDSFNGNIGVGATPNFDNIANKGLKFTNCYANGQRSIDGITSIMTGLTVPIGLNYLGSGLELSNLTYLGKLATANGYETIASQSSNRSSFRVDAITRLAGFKKYFGAEDFPANGQEQKHTPPSFGTWDGNMYKFLANQLNDTKQPFISFSFTSSTHTAFVSPGKKWEKFTPHNNGNFIGFLNTLYYADDQLGYFFNDIKNQPWFDNTIFILTADHTNLFKQSEEKLISSNTRFPAIAELDRQKIPLVVYAPKIFKPRTIDDIVSHNDIFPSLIDMLNWHGNFSTISNSFFDTNVKNRFAFIKNSETEYLIKQNGISIHTLSKSIRSTSKDIDTELLAIDQILSNAILTNKIAPY